MARIQQMMPLAFKPVTWEFFWKIISTSANQTFFKENLNWPKERVLLLPCLHSPDFLHPPPLGLTVPRCSKSSRIFPASYPSQKCHLIWPKALERKNFRAANFGKTYLWKPDCPALTHSSHLTFFALNSWKEFYFPKEILRQRLKDYSHDVSILNSDTMRSWIVKFKTYKYLVFKYLS